MVYLIFVSKHMNYYRIWKLEIQPKFSEFFLEFGKTRVENVGKEIGELKDQSESCL